MTIHAKEHPLGEGGPPGANGHDRRVGDARAVRIEDEIARRGMKLRGGNDRCGPCPACGGDDRFAINIKEQVFNCRGCGAKGHGAIDLVMFLGGCDFMQAVETLAGAAAFQLQATARPPETFFYHDESGAVIYRVERVDRRNPDGSFVLDETGKRKKDFYQSRPDPGRPGQWIKGIKGFVDPVPYRLPDLLKALSNWELIVIAEGERCVDVLRKGGFAATCNSGGHGNRAIWAKHAEYFCKAKSPDVVILPDNDDQGRDHANTVAAYLTEAGARVRILDLTSLPNGEPMPPKGDIVNWASKGGTAKQLCPLIDSDAWPWAPSEAEFPTDGPSVNAERPLLREQEPPAIITRRASDITPEPISWLWKYWLARGKLHIIGGVPETGKTTIALAFAAIVSSGATWPDGTRAAVGNVLIWTSEDGPADTLVPRLIRMGADLSRIYFIEEAIPPGAKSRPFNPATDMLALVAKAASIGDVVLLILDPVVAAMPMTRNSHNNAETRNGMQPVVDFAEAADIATIGISHLTKGTAGKDPLERLNGSGAFGALPRLVMGGREE